MATDQELEIIKKMDAADYVGFLRDSEGVESDWLLHYYRFCCYSRGLGVSRDLNAARAELLPVLNTIVAEAEAGDGMAQNAMGILMEQGCPTATGREPPNAPLARQWFFKSAESGYSKGQFNYARVCKNGIGGPRRAEECLKWWRTAADQGCPRSQCSLAVFLARQKDGTPDVGTIAELLRKAAAGGQADAWRIVAKCGDDLSDARVYAELLIDLAEGELRRRQALATDEPSFSISLPANWKQSHDENWVLSHQPKGSQMPPAADSRKSVIPDLNRANASFSALLIKYVRDRFGGDAPSVYHAARINRKTYSAIISDELRAVSKRTAVAFALALKLSRTDADEFLRAAGFALSSSIREDMVFNACIEAGIYDLARVNQILVNHQARPFPETEEDV